MESTTEGARYISHMLGEISEDEYQAINLSFSEAIKKFGRLRQRPAFIFIDKWFAEKTLTGEKIFNYLRTYGFSKGIAQKVMSKLVANEISVIPDLQYRGYNIKDIEYNTDYTGRLEILGLKEVIPYYPRQVEIKIRPIKVIPEISQIKMCSQFTIIDAFGGSKSRSVEESITHSINHRDILNVLITPDQYDGALPKAEKPINDVIIGFFGIKNPNLKWKNIEDLRHSRGYNEECPKHRTYEFDIVLSDSFEIEFSMKYSEGNVVPGSVIGNVPLGRIIPILKSIGAWEK